MYYRRGSGQRNGRILGNLMSDTLYIAALWDTCREPAAQADNI